jgi:uncharacterized protein (DUF924 family)
VSTPEEALSYWFPEGIDVADPETRGRQMERWMAGGTEVDRGITERFDEVLEQARRGELDYSQQTITKLLTSYTYPSSGCRGGTSR